MIAVKNDQLRKLFSVKFKLALSGAIEQMIYLGENLQAQEGIHMCSALMTAYLLVMSSTSGIACIPMEDMSSCRAAISDFSQNFVETRRSQEGSPSSTLRGPGYTIVTPQKRQRLERSQKPDFALTCVRGKKN